MSVFYLFYLFVIAVVLTFVFTYLLRIRGPWGSIWTFFIVLFLGIWAISLWVTPFGPLWRDIYWIPPLAIGILLVLLLAATVPSPRARARIEKEMKETGRPVSAPVVVGTFFWVFLIVLIGIILAGMF